MKNVGRYIAIVTIGACGSVHAAVQRCDTPPALSAEFAAPAPRDLAYPSFCDIPTPPKHIPTAQAFKADVVSTRLSGAAVVGETAPDTWSLSGTEAFEATAKREAAPPPPMTPADEPGTEAFVAKSKASAKPPPKPRRHP